MITRSSSCRNLVVAAVFASPWSAAAAWSQQPARPANDREGVTALLTSLVEAYNKADAEALAGLFAANAVSIAGDGEEVSGAEAIVARYAAAFEDGPTAQLAGQVASIRFPTPDVACVSGDFQLLDEGEIPFTAGRFCVLAVKGDGKWRVAELRDESVEVAPPASNEERLEELAWMVGEWLDESEGVRVETRIDWAENRNFLVRTYTLQIDGEAAASGTQWIGWDASTEQIKSWVFDSEGGHGSGTWTNVGDAWIIKATGVLRNGDSTSATQIIEKVNNDAARFRSTERVIGGELMPDVDEVVMVRKPPAPGGEKPAKP